MRERPIIFSAPMVRALLDGGKTQTRRIIKQPDPASIITGALPCPYGSPGDHLWVKETWKPHIDYDTWRPSLIPVSQVAYAADGRLVPAPGKWRPSLFMPRWASRLTLEVTGIRRERLQDISAADCRAEGAGDGPESTPCENYRKVWESINGAGSWAANPWVWVIEFTRLPVDVAAG